MSAEDIRAAMRAAEDEGDAAAAAAVEREAAAEMDEFTKVRGRHASGWGGCNKLSNAALCDLVSCKGVGPPSGMCHGSVNCKLTHACLTMRRSRWRCRLRLGRQGTTPPHATARAAQWLARPVLAVPPRRGSARQARRWAGLLLLRRRWRRLRRTT